ncbi:hypothetical protein CKW00_04050 [Salimicrobium humidisoli]|uniref:Uncharacterized protein n=1 Tax=Salimicrobium humidisoli TaxID=2029857 RepID=A0ABX4HSM3_9BACI|nr:hypothetical protein CKW00_04050 [Salimicrobium humidisoli]
MMFIGRFVLFVNDLFPFRYLHRSVFRLNVTFPALSFPSAVHFPAEGHDSPCFVTFRHGLSA